MSQTHTIYFDVIINEESSKVFQAISDPKSLVNWWPKTCEGEQKLDGIYNLFFTEAYNWFGKVTSYNPNTHFEIKMTQASEDWLPTTFGFELEPSNHKTRLKFYHKNWKSINAHYRHSAFCWAMLLNGLKNYIENGEIIPFEKRN
ncbi:MAG: hypothetical protein BM564_01105 [Bacteroidetes bacterium MedPE-SWsnd-G2]|nr:MAG: hypothetical protein BM564_01105 [Bacteroidetes bacterium MedPE-SWsnd-G2]